jgi:hypothetical protein
MIQTLQAAKFTDLKGGRPALDPPIPDRVVTALAGTSPDRNRLQIGVASVFGANVYSLQAFADSEQDLATLLKVVDTLKEAKKSPPGTAT